MRRIFFVLIVLLGIVSSTGANDPVPGTTSKDDELIATLIEDLDDRDAEVRQNIAYALANIGETALPSLIEALTCTKPERRMGAAIALAQMRPAPKSAVPALLRAMKDKDEGVRRQVSYALSRIVSRDNLINPVKTERPPNVPPPDPTPAPSSTGGAR